MKRFFLFVCLGCLVIGIVSAGGRRPASTGTGAKLTPITLYPDAANVVSGKAQGFRQKIFAQRGIDLEIWPFSPERTNVILASGDLPDVMFVQYDALKTLIESGQVLNLEPHLSKLPHITGDEFIVPALNYVRRFRSTDTGNLYGIPAGISVPVETEDTGRNAVKVNWEVYHALGEPEIKSIDDLIPLMKRMMAAKPVADDGTRTWGTVLNAGADQVFWRSIEIWLKWFGYEPDNLAYLLETDMLNARYGNILELGRNSLYYKGLKWYNTAYNEGVLDPDSINNDRETQKVKVERSRAVMVPSGSLPGWGGYQPIYIPGQKLCTEFFGSYYGRDSFVAISAKSKNIDAALTMVDLLADPDAYFEIWNGTQEEGLWYIGDDGITYPTKSGLDQTVNNVVNKTEIFSPNGERMDILWFDTFIRDFTYYSTHKAPDSTLRQARTMNEWIEVKAITDNSPEKVQWRERFGYKNFTAQLKANNTYTLVSPLFGVTAFCPLPDDTMKLMLEAIRNVVVNASWKMVYAKTNAEFDANWDQMIRDCRELGADSIIKWRLNELDKAARTKASLQG